MASIKKFFHFRKQADLQKSPTAIRTLWKYELLAGLILLCAFLAADFWLYRSVSQRPLPPAETISGVTLLNESALVDAAKTLEINAVLLKNTMHSVLMKSPF